MNKFALKNKLIVGKDFYFEAAHKIPGHEKCGRIHGHSYRIRVICEGYIQENGMVIDFEDIKKVVIRNVVDKLDHRYLNEIEDLEIPTTENLCVWIMDKLITELPCLRKVKVWETRDSYAELTNEGNINMRGSPIG